MNLFSTVTKTIKTIKPGDRMFKFSNGLVMCDRASIEIAHQCPKGYADIIAECYNNGWIKPVAHVTEKEYVLLGLTQE